MTVKIGINGFGRIGRLVLRAACDRKDVEVVGINDPFISPDYASYLLRYDTIHGHFNGTVEYTENSIIVNGKEIKMFAEKEPNKIDWKGCGAEYIAEATGKFTDPDGAKLHFEGGAKKVVISTVALLAPKVIVPLLIKMPKTTASIKRKTNATLKIIVKFVFLTLLSVFT